MSGRVLLDTNIVVADSTVNQQLSLIQEILVPSIVVGELMYGARKSQLVEIFVANATIPICSFKTAPQYAIIKC